MVRHILNIGKSGVCDGNFKILRFIQYINVMKGI